MSDMPLLTEEEERRILDAGRLLVALYSAMGVPNPVFILWTADTGWDIGLVMVGSS